MSSSTLLPVTKKPLPVGNKHPNNTELDINDKIDDLLALERPKRMHEETFKRLKQIRVKFAGAAQLFKTEERHKYKRIFASADPSGNAFSLGLYINKNHRLHCHVCNFSLSLVQSGQSRVYYHLKTKKHLKNFKAWVEYMKNRSDDDDDDEDETDDESEQDEDDEEITDARSDDDSDDESKSESESEEEEEKEVKHSILKNKNTRAAKNKTVKKPSWFNDTTDYAQWNHLPQHEREWEIHKKAARLRFEMTMAMFGPNPTIFPKKNPPPPPTCSNQEIERIRQKAMQRLLQPHHQHRHSEKRNKNHHSAAVDTQEGLPRRREREEDVPEKDIVEEEFDDEEQEEEEEYDDDTSESVLDQDEDDSQLKIKQNTSIPREPRRIPTRRRIELEQTTQNTSSVDNNGGTNNADKLNFDNRSHLAKEDVSRIFSDKSKIQLLEQNEASRTCQIAGVKTSTHFAFREYMVVDLESQCGLKPLIDIPDPENAASPENNFINQSKLLKKVVFGKRCCFHQLDTLNLFVGSIIDVAVVKTKKGEITRQVQVAPDKMFEIPGQTLTWVDLHQVCQLPEMVGVSNPTAEQYDSFLKKEIEKLRQKVRRLAKLKKVY